MKRIIILFLLVTSTALAFNLSPYTYKVRSRATPADSLYIKGDTLYCNQMAVSLHAVMKAIAVQTDTVRGAFTVVGITDDTLVVDADSTGSLVTVRFGRWGGGLRWNRSTDKMQFTNDFSTWTDIGSGGVGTDEDSTFIAHYSSRWRPLGDSAAQYIGDTGDSTVFRFIGASTTSNTDDTVISFCKIYYGESVVDSALVTYGTLEAAVAALGSGDITGVITSGDWLEGGASSGDVALNIKAIYEDAYQVIEDTTAIEGTAIKLRQPSGYSAITMVDNAITVHNGISGSIVLNVDGTPTNTDEMTITENNIAIRSAGSNGLLYLLGYDLERVAHVAVGSMLTSGGTSSAPTWQSIKTVIDSLTGTAIPLSDSTSGGAARAEVTKTVAHPWLYAYIDTSRARIPASDTAYVLLHSFAYNYIDTSSAIIPRATLADSTNGGAIRAEAAKIAYRLTAAQGSANTFGRMVGDSIDVDSIHAGRISIGTDASITDITGDGLTIVAGALTASLGTAITSSEITDGTIALGDMGSNSVDSTKITDGGIGSGDIGTGRITTTHVLDNTLAAADIATGGVATAEILDRTVAAIDIDTSATIKADEFNGNWLTAWPDSTLSLGSGAGLTIGSSITLGTDITDDTLVVDYYPEYTDAVLADAIMSTWKDSIKIYGDIESNGGMGNVMLFNDSVLTSGLHRRGVQIAIKHPLRVDSLRYIIVQGLVKDSSATNTMFLKGILRTSTFTSLNVDSNAAGNVKDYDSLGGDFTDNASIRQFVLSGGAITEGSPWYLLLIARHGSGTAWNWAKAGRIRAVYSRTRL